MKTIYFLFLKIPFLLGGWAPVLVLRGMALTYKNPQNIPDV
jgi:hypothetical protein